MPQYIGQCCWMVYQLWSRALASAAAIGLRLKCNSSKMGLPRSSCLPEYGCGSIPGARTVA